MKVHVVCLEDNWILWRYARYMAAYSKWTTGPQPRDDVHVNHYLPYLLYQWRHEHPSNTKKSAWFTHLEEKERKANKPNSKTKRWHRAAREMDLRLCQARKYFNVLKPLGPTVQMPSPVDPIFTPRKLRVGIAGRVYSTGRKGEHLVQRLVESQEFEVIGAGEGWPCPTKFYERGQLPDFFRSLDVYLVTALVDGGPDTVIEALACGTPVVGPRDVGFIEEFDGVMLYTKGDYGAMVSCLRRYSQALVAQQDRLRRAVQHRTPERWAKAHRKAFQEHL